MAAIPRIPETPLHGIDCRGRRLSLDSRPLVMGILNCTPDSFSDGGRYLAIDAACERARRMVEAGCDILDVGGESTRPGADPVTEKDEIARVVPLIEALAGTIGVPISIDTRKAEVMRAAVAAGAAMINDVEALQGPGSLAAAAELAVPVCLMHMRGEPKTMQQAVAYEDVVGEVIEFLRLRIETAVAAGIPRQRLIVDPGFGFGKRLEDNLALLRGLPRIAELGLPVLVGLSRKSMIGQLIDRPVEDRLSASLALAVLAVQQGARIVRVHDVSETVDALAMVRAVAGERRVEQRTGGE